MATHALRAVYTAVVSPTRLAAMLVSCAALVQAQAVSEPVRSVSRPVRFVTRAVIVAAASVVFSIPRRLTASVAKTFRTRKGQCRDLLHRLAICLQPEFKFHAILSYSVTDMSAHIGSAGIVAVRSCP